MPRVVGNPALVTRLGLLLGFVVAMACRTTTAPVVPLPLPMPPTDVALLPAFDPAAQVAGLPTASRNTPLAVRDVRPFGPGDGAGIRLRFDRLVVDPASPPPGTRLLVQRVSATGELVEVPSTSAWTRGDTLTATPLGDLRAAHTYQVKLIGGDALVEGGIASSWTFETARPTLSVYNMDWYEVARRGPIIVQPSQPVAPAVLAKHLVVSARPKSDRDHDDAAKTQPVPAKRVDVRVRRATAHDFGDEPVPDHALVIEPRRAWPPSSDLDLEVAANMVGTLGPLSLVDTWHGLATTEDVLAIGALACSGGEDGRCPIGTIEIPTGVSVDNPEAVRVVPALAGITRTRGSNDDGDPIIEIDGDWVDGRRYTFIVPSSLVDDGGDRLGKTHRLAMKVDAALTNGRGDLWLAPWSGIFATPADARVGIRGTNARELEVRLAVMPAADANKWLHAERLSEVPWPDDAREQTLVLRPATRSIFPDTVVLDLGKYAGLGEVVLVEVHATTMHPAFRGEQPMPVRGLFSISSLGVSVQRSPTQGFVRVTALATGEPVVDAEVALHDPAGKVLRRRTDRHGLARLPAPDLEGKRAHVVVSTADDAVWQSLGLLPWVTPRSPRSSRAGLSGRLALTPPPVVDPSSPTAILRPGEIAAVGMSVGRGVFMPGDRVDFAGWGTISTPHEALATRSVPPGTEVVVELRSDDDMRVVARAKAKLDEHGRFSGGTRVPSFARLGNYTGVVRMLGAEGTAWFVVSEARIPAFEVSVVPQRDVIERGDDLSVRFAATLLSGSATAVESARVTIACNPSSPPTMRFLPEGFSADSSRDADGSDWMFFLRRSPNGEHSVVQPTTTLDHRRPMHCAIDIAAVDVRLHEIGASNSVHVDPASKYLAVAVPEEPQIGRQDLRLLAVDLTGRPVAQSGVELTLWRQGRDGGRLSPALHRCRVDLAADGTPALCRTPRLASGTYEIQATADVDGKPIEYMRALWIPPPPERDADADEPEPTPPAPAPAREVAFEIEKIDDITPDRPVPIVVRGPWTHVRGVLAVEQTGLREVIPFEMRDGVARVHTRAAVGRGPSLVVSAHVTPPPTTTVHATEVVTRQSAVVDHLSQLKVAVTVPKRARPGERVPIAIRVADTKGTPVDARLAVWVVDEGLHLLRRPRFNLGPFFDADRRGERRIDRSFDRLVEPFDGWFHGRSRRAPSIRQASAQVKGSLGDPIGRHFDPAPLFVGNVGTGPDGEVEIPLVLPDDLTRFRIEAIASASVTGHPESGPVRFGFGNQTIAVSTPLELRPALPRGLRPGDEATIGAVVSVPRRGELEVEVELVADDGAVTILGESKRTIAVEPGTQRVDFRVAASSVGTAKVQLRGTLRPHDREAPLVAGVEQSLRVHVDRTQIELAARSGSVDDDTPVAIPVALPKKSIPGHGAITVSTSATTIGELDAATEYLVDYPYECLEQTTSRLVPIVAFAALPDGWTQREPAVARAAELVAKIATMQRNDGELMYWPGASEVDPHASAYALWVLHLAKQRGIEVDDVLLRRATDAVRARLDRRVGDRADGRATTASVDDVTALHALSLGGKLAPSDFDHVFKHRASLPPYGRIMLLMALHRVAAEDPRLEELQNDLSALIEERESVAHVVEPIERYVVAFDSAARDDALALMALLQIAPEDPRIDKLARGLRDRRRGGRWRTTQENAFALLALSDYARLREPAAPNHQVEGWIGKRRVVDAAVKGRATTTRSGSVALDEVARDRRDDGTVAVVVGREGKGRTHYRVDVTWAELDPPARKQGLSLVRRIVDEDGKAVDELRAGQRYRLEIEIETPGLQHHLAVEVPLPLGLEPVDAELGSGAAARVVDGPTSPDVSHKELRTDRVLLFFDALPGGKHLHSVPVFAVTAGSFTMPPAVAEAMYEPETRARTTKQQVRIAPVEAR